MKIELEQADIEAVARRTAELILPKLLAKQADKDEETFFSTQGLADYFKVPISWVYNKVHLKQIPYVKHGKYTRFRKSEIDAWNLEHSVKPE